MQKAKLWISIEFLVTPFSILLYSHFIVYTCLPSNLIHPPYPYVICTLEFILLLKKLIFPVNFVLKFF